MPESCLFCRIATRQIPADLVYEDADTLAFRDLNPQAPVHILVIPRQHIAGLIDTPQSPLFDALFAAVRAVAAREGLVASGFRTVINTGRDAQQSVDHLHVHVLGGRGLTWPPG